MAVPDLATYLAFLAAVLAYQLSGPGPDMLLVMSRGVGQGWRVALSTALGCVAAGVIQIPLLALGLASLVASSPVAYEILRLAGAGYLIYLGLGLLFPRRSAGSLEGVVDPTPDITWGAAFRQGMVCNLTNPTVLTFMLAILPQFVDPSSGPAGVQLLVLGATMKGTGLLTLGSVALASGAVGGWLSRHGRLLVWQERFAGAVMIALGLRLLFAGEARPALR
jgi:threonine/homoserine/homoserine lactone efflux protein